MMTAEDNPAAHQRVFTHSIVPDFDDFTVVSDGIGDISLIGAVPALDIDRQSLVVNGGRHQPRISAASGGVPGAVQSRPSVAERRQVLRR